MVAPYHSVIRRSFYHTWASTFLFKKISILPHCLEKNAPSQFKMDRYVVTNIKSRLISNSVMIPLIWGSKKITQSSLCTQGGENGLGAILSIKSARFLNSLASWSLQFLFSCPPPWDTTDPTLGFLGCFPVITPSHLCSQIMADRMVDYFSSFTLIYLNPTLF